ncbi:hypothetical protein T4A_7300 [Trichinella pseudospiralis]|uniref:Uncharacterized protein n=1 Tax=Trichinella pseudospiralis TaxID=6337 RepID=A0A0V1F0K5_TRIPS|nr:hypothetical protein T4A_7300 [Trichinella pseudospiralis]
MVDLSAGETTLAVNLQPATRRNCTIKFAVPILAKDDCPPSVVLQDVDVRFYVNGCQALSCGLVPFMTLYSFLMALCDVAVISLQLHVYGYAGKEEN